MKNKKVLLVGTSFSAVPLLIDLKEKGFHISVCGGLENDPCHSYSDDSFFIDYSKNELLLEVCKENHFDYIIPSCNDYAYNSSSYVATKLNKFYGFDNIETTMLLHTKNSFRKFTLDNNLSAPKAIKYQESLDLSHIDLEYPILVKPDYSFSGKGITKVYNLDELSSSISHAKNNSKNGELILEEFVEGDLYSHSAFIENKKIKIDFFVNEYCTVYPYQVDYSHVSNDLSEEIKDKIRKEINFIANKLDLVNGLLHTQFISDSNKKFWLIETMRRCPGDLYGTLIKDSMDFKYSNAYINYFLNEKSIEHEVNGLRENIFRHTISSDKRMIFTSVENTLLSNNTKFIPLKNSGEILDMAPNDKVGIVFVKVESYGKLKEYSLRLKDLIKIKGIEVD